MPACLVPHRQRVPAASLSLLNGTCIELAPAPAVLPLARPAPEEARLLHCCGDRGRQAGLLCRHAIPVQNSSFNDRRGQFFDLNPDHRQGRRQRVAVIDIAID